MVAASLSVRASLASMAALTAVTMDSTRTGLAPMFFSLGFGSRTALMSLMAAWSSGNMISFMILKGIVRCSS